MQKKHDQAFFFFFFLIIIIVSYLLDMLTLSQPCVGYIFRVSPYRYFDLAVGDCGRSDLGSPNPQRISFWSLSHLRI